MVKDEPETFYGPVTRHLGIRRAYSTLLCLMIVCSLFSVVLFSKRGNKAAGCGESVVCDPNLTAISCHSNRNNCFWRYSCYVCVPASSKTSCNILNERTSNECKIVLVLNTKPGAYVFHSDSSSTLELSRLCCLTVTGKGFYY